MLETNRMLHGIESNCQKEKTWLSGTNNFHISCSSFALVFSRDAARSCGHNSWNWDCAHGSAQPWFQEGITFVKNIFSQLWSHNSVTRDQDCSMLLSALVLQICCSIMADPVTFRMHVFAAMIIHLDISSPYVASNSFSALHMQSCFVAWSFGCWPMQQFCKEYTIMLAV